MDVKSYEKPEYYVNRELSWIKFNERVLSEEIGRASCRERVSG